VRLEGLGQLKNPMTSSGLEHATFGLVAQCLNQLRYSVPHIMNTYTHFLCCFPQAQPTGLLCSCVSYIFRLKHFFGYVTPRDGYLTERQAEVGVNPRGSTKNIPSALVTIRAAQNIQYMSWAQQRNTDNYGHSDDGGPLPKIMDT
jgi:hypothetical protein